MGNISFPISKAYIYGVVPTLSISFKLGGASGTVGTAMFDGRAAVYCRLGRDPFMIPIDVNIAKENGKAAYRFEIVRHKVYVAYLASAAVSSAITAVAGQWDEQSLSMNLRIDCRLGGQSYIITNTFRYVMTPTTYSLAQLLSELAGYLNILVNNGFAEVEIDKVTVDASLTRNSPFYTLVSAVLDKQTYYTGENAIVKVVLKKYRGGFVTRTMTVPMPGSAVSGSYKVYIGSQYELNNQIANLFPYQYRINNMEDLVRIANEPSDMSFLQALFVGFNEGIVYRRRGLPNFPEPYISILNIRNDSGKNYAFPEITGDDLRMDAPVFGNQALTFNLYDRLPQEIEIK